MLPLQDELNKGLKEPTFSSQSLVFMIPAQLVLFATNWLEFLKHERPKEGLIDRRESLVSKSDKQAEEEAESGSWNMEVSLRC